MRVKESIQTRRSIWFFIGLFFLLAFFPARMGSSFRTLFQVLGIPLAGLTVIGQSVGERARWTLTPKRVLAQRLLALEQENQKLQIQLLQAKEWEAENARLRKLLGWKQQSPWRVLPARILYRDTAEWWHVVWIDRGKRDGIRPNLPVIVPEGLVGRIAQVGPVSSKVVLVGSPQCKVAALIQESGEQGVIVTPPGGMLDYRLVTLTYLPRSVTLEPGQLVVTSGLGGIFPPGIPIGRIVDWRTVGYGLYTEAQVKLLIHPNRLREVFVLFP